jgi:hypothetical protein
MAECSDLSKIQISICEKSDDTNTGDNVMKSITNDIVCVLQLEDNENKDQIVNHLLESGRQSLVKYQNDIILEIYTAEMDSDTGKLINLLKKYFEQQWEARYGASSQWFISFLKQYQNGEKHDLYEQVLTCTAECVNEYTRECPILSIVLQLLFEGIDDQCLKETNVFNELWFRITTDGIESTTKFSDYIIEDVMNEQKTNKQSPLFLALRVYYDEPVSLLLKKSNVRVNDDVKSTALEKIAYHGLLKGAEVIEPKTTRNLYAKLKENIHFYLKEQKEKYLARTRVIDSISLPANMQSESKLTEKVTTSNENQGNHNLNRIS